ncbi:trypsin-1-like [Phymastichus coffea]|uniref:trypsin-1-like n=1 Tax=Phymastichus coffea TaxID=108790 RepID=UPI00273C1F85|nr:trypsin-1-like [Phymastichus coffea]
MYRVAVSCVLLALVNGKPWHRRAERPTAELYTPHGRIIGGKPTTIETHPWQVSLQAYGFHFCGASIVADQWILTAGHCAGYSPDLTTVRVGSSVMEEGGAVHALERVIRHENFTKSAKGIPHHDIALMKLKTKIDFNERTQPVALFEQNEKCDVGTIATISGWGTTIENGDMPEVLHTVDVPIVSKSACNEAYESWGGIPVGQICAAYPQGGKDTCQGDSGGPLVIDGRQAGIVSWGNGCARKGYPGAYTEVAYYRDWISEKSGI